MRSPAVRFDLSTDFFRQIIAGTVVECDIRPFAREDFAKGCANPTCSAGDERSFTFE